MKSSSPPVVRVDPKAPEAADLAEAARLLREGGLVAFPTETVYGLGANALEEAAVHRIFEAKGRPPSNPIIVHVTGVEQARTLVAAWPEAADALASRFWPGPVTLVLPKAQGVPGAVTAGLDSVAIRMPSHPVARALLAQAGVPVAAPSANRYTGVSPTSAQHVVRSLGDSVDLVVDGGSTDVGIESTVVSLVHEPKVLRPGMVSWEVLQEIVADLQPHEEHSYVEDDEPATSPGQARRHYSPDARVILAEPETRRGFADERVAVVRLETGPFLGDAFVIDLPADPHLYARRLYDALHRVDEAGCDLVLIQPPPRTPAWSAIWDRLRRAAGLDEES